MKIFELRFLALFFFVTLQLLNSDAVKSQIVRDQYGNDYIVANPKMIRGTIGFSTMSLSMDTMAPRKAWGINTRDEARIISAFMDEDNRFAIRDAFFCDLTLGALRSKPLAYYKSYEKKFSGTFSFGYDIVAGYRNELFGVFAGKGFHWDAAFIGSSWIPGDALLLGNHPFLFRGEFHIGKNKGDEFRVVANAWSNFKGELKKSYGGDINIPISNQRRIWLMAQYKVIAGDAAPANYDNNKYTTGTLTQFTIGIKTGSIY